MPKGEIPLVATSEGRLLLFTLHFIEFHFIFACWQRRFSCFSEDRKMLKMRQPAAGYRIFQNRVRSVNTSKCDCEYTSTSTPARMSTLVYRTGLLCSLFVKVVTLFACCAVSCRPWLKLKLRQGGWKQGEGGACREHNWESFTLCLSSVWASLGVK